MCDYVPQFKGKNVFLQLGMGRILFLAANTYVLAAVICHHRFSSVFKVFGKLDSPAAVSSFLQFFSKIQNICLILGAMLLEYMPLLNENVVQLHKETSLYHYQCIPLYVYLQISSFYPHKSLIQKCFFPQSILM
jgi:hypothetical protein